KRLRVLAPPAADVVAHLRAARLAHALEVAVLELDTRAAVGRGAEAHFDLGGEGGTRVGLPLGADLPADDQAPAGLPYEYVADHRDGVILVAGIPAPADERLDHRL